MTTSLDSGQDAGSFPSVAACEVTSYVLGSLEETEANNELKHGRSGVTGKGDL